MFKRDKQRTPKQKAERAQLNIFVRLAGCALLIYYAVQLLRTPKEQQPGPTVTIIITVVFFALAAIVIGITILDWVRGIQTGRYKATRYEDEEMIEFLESQKAENPEGASENAPAELETHEGEAEEPDDGAASDSDKKDDKES